MPYLILDRATAQAAPAVTFGAPLTSTGKTLGDIRTELKLRLGNRTDVLPPRYDSWINEAYLDIATSLGFMETKDGFAITLTAGQPLYLLPSGVRSVQLVSLIDATTFSGAGGIPLDPTDLVSYRKYPDADGTPRKWFRQRDMLVLWPTPTGIEQIAVDIKVKIQKLTTDTDSPIFDEEWHEALLLLAVAKGHAALKEWELAVAADNNFVSWVKRRSIKETDERQNQIPRMRPVRRAADLNWNSTLERLGEF